MQGFGVAHIRVTNNIRPVQSYAGKRCVNSSGGRKGKPVVCRNEEGKLPVAKSQINHPAGKFRTLVNKRADQIVAQVMITDAMIGIAIERVLVSVASEPVTNWLGALQAVGISVGSEQGIVVAETTLQRCLGAIVAGVDPSSSWFMVE